MIIGKRYDLESRKEKRLKDSKGFCKKQKSSLKE